MGKMLLQAGANYPAETWVMEMEGSAPAAHLAHHFVKGDFRKFDDVYNFGKGLDAVAIEIEAVNEEALKKLEDEGVKVYPSSRALGIIKNKVVQKQFYKEHGIPSADFVITEKRAEVLNHSALFPAIHKIGLGGYDGRGVISIKNKEEASAAFDAQSVLEKKVDIAKELSVIVAVGNDRKTVTYPAVDMVFDPVLNLLDYQISPAKLPEAVLRKADEIALAVVKSLDSAGIFAVELFIDKENNVLVNETAPRVHNSGHHTIEANYCSQFDMLWRVMLDYPLGNTGHIVPAAAIVNIIGAEGYSGKADYEGLEKVLAMHNVFVHIYGKPETKPGKKMGHATILGRDSAELIKTAHKIKDTLTVKSK